MSSEQRPEADVTALCTCIDPDARAACKRNSDRRKQIHFRHDLCANWERLPVDCSFYAEALEEALARFGVLEIFITDQGSQFTSAAAFTAVATGGQCKKSCRSRFLGEASHRRQAFDRGSSEPFRSHLGIQCRQAKRYQLMPCGSVSVN
jgi:hypothetical protein